MGVFLKHHYLKQRALLWTKTSVDSQGMLTFNSPTQIRCLWNNGEGEDRDEFGVMFSVMATVYPDREISVGSYLKLADADSSDTSDPIGDGDAYKVKKSAAIKSANGRKTMHEVKLG